MISDVSEEEQAEILSPRSYCRLIRTQAVDDQQQSHGSGVKLWSELSEPASELVERLRSAREQRRAEQQRH